MLKNFLTIAFRNLSRQKFYAFINITGLAVGIACCLLIVLFVQDELRYDQHHVHADRIYRTATDIKFGDMEGKMAYMPAPLGPTLIRDFPEVETATRIRDRGGVLVRRGDTDNIKEEGLAWADHELFDVFTLPLIQGDPQVVLTEPNTLVISERMARKYFGEEHALGEVLTLDNQTDYRIVGVMENLPANSHFHFDFFLAMVGSDQADDQIWLSHNFHTYLLLREGADPDALQAKFPAMLEQYAGPQVEMFLGKSLDKFEASGDHIGYFLQPLLDIHLHSDLDGELSATGDIRYIYIFSAIAIFILLIACINFMNLSTARSANRALEVGIRKVMGSNRSELILQFLMESVILSLLAFGISLALAYWALPFFNNLAVKQMSLPLQDPFFWTIMFSASLLIGLLAGVYPAFFLSAFRPIHVLKGRLGATGKGKWVRSGLVVFQFFASIVLIICTLGVYQQLSYLQDKKLGYSKDQVLILQDTYVLQNQVYAFRDELKEMPEVENVTVTGFMPVPPSYRNSTAYWPEGEQNQERTQIIGSWVVDHNYLQTMEMEIVLGRDFSLDFPTDSQAVIINETAVKRWGFEDPIGQKIVTFDGDPDEEGSLPTRTRTVIGVVKDFHYESLRENIAGLAMFIGGSRGSVAARFNTEDIDQVLTRFEEKWTAFAPGQPFTYSFLDERFANQYRTEQRLGKIFASFAFLAILVGCLGLFALATFMAEQRTREIGIRKVLGASVPNILILLSKDFALLVLIALILSIPVSWYAMQSWLEGFSYHTEVGPLMFFFAGTLAMAIAMCTVAFQAWRAARANPIEALKYE